MNTVYRNIEYFFICQLYSLKTLFAYRFQGMVWLFYSLISVVNAFVAITVIYNISTGITGWNYYQLLLLAAATSMAMGVSAIFTSSGWEMIWHMRHGTIDPYLAKPYTTLAIMLSNFGDASQLSAIGGGLLMFAYAAFSLQISLASLLVFAAMFALGLGAFVMFIMMITIAAYHLFKSGQFMDQINNILMNAGRYPLKVYTPIGQLIFSVLLPIGVASYYPSTVILNEASPVGFVEVVIIAVVLFWVSHRLFYALMKRYTSGGG